MHGKEHHVSIDVNQLSPAPRSDLRCRYGLAPATNIIIYMYVVYVAIFICFRSMSGIAYALAQERYFKRVWVSIMPVAAWQTSWTKTPAKWVDYPDSLQQAFATFKIIEHEVPKLQEYAQQFTQLKDVPWMEIAREIADGVNRRDACLESADDMMSTNQLRRSLEDWRKNCVSVDKLIEWTLFPEGRASKILAEFSRPGAYEQPFLC